MELLPGDQPFQDWNFRDVESYLELTVRQQALLEKTQAEYVNNFKRQNITKKFDVKQEYKLI